MNSGLWGFLTMLSLVLALVFVAIAAVFVKRLGDRTPTSDKRRNRQRESGYEESTQRRTDVEG